MKNPLIRGRAIAPWIAVLALVALCAVPAGAVPTVGDRFPAITLGVPDGAGDRNYLGISGSTTFTVRDIRADIVVVEFYNMYCPHCQADAPTTVDLFNRISRDPRLSGRVRMIGIGMGNSDYEVGIFRKKYHIPFPLFPDGDYAILNMMDIRFTPTYIVLTITGGKATVAYVHTGRITDIGSFITILTTLH